MKRLLVVAGVAVLALLGAATPAAAHNVLISSDPADGARLDTAPPVVTLTFDQPVQDDGVNEIAVTGPSGGQWAEGAVEVDRTVVTRPLRPLGPAGEYVIGFRVLSADGHPVSDEIRFTLTQPGEGTEVPPTTGTTTTRLDQAERPEDQTGVPVWVWIVGGVVLLGAGITVALRMGRSQED